MSHNVETTDIQRTPFSGGTRFSIRLDGGAYSLTELTQLDWSLGRFACDRAGLLKIVDVPSHPSPAEPRDCEYALTESFPILVSDSVNASRGGLKDGIEIEGATYRSPRGRTTRWQFSAGLQRLRGTATLAPITNSPLPELLGYLLRLNADLRFARVGCLEGEIAMQIVVPFDDRHWFEVAERALGTLFDVLLRQAAWWSKPPELLAELFHLCER